MMAAQQHRPPSRRYRRFLSVMVAGALAAITPGFAAAKAESSQSVVRATLVAKSNSPTITLVTGQKVAIRKDREGRTSYLLQPAGPQDDGVISWQMGVSADHYVVPIDALPFLGKGLDPSLFDVTALAHKGLVGDARIPVTLAFAAGVAPTAPPGVTLTSVTGSMAQGYLSPGSARAFVSQLHQQIGADVALGRRPGSTPLFGGLTSMAVAGTVRSVTPQYPMHILQVTATDALGAPADELAFVMNNDSLLREAAIMPIVDGLGRIAVPSGDYSIATALLDWDNEGNLTDIRQVTALDVTVPDTGSAPVVNLDAKAATSLVSLRTPRPSTREVTGLDVERVDATGQNAANLGLESWNKNARIEVTPASAPTVGRLQYRTRFDAVGADSSGEAYRYDAAFSTDHIDADQAYAVDASRMATVHHTFSADPASDPVASLTVGPYDSGYLLGTEEVSGYTFLTMPQHLTEYVQTYPGSRWSETVFTSSGEMHGDSRAFAGGQTYDVDWLHGPLAPTLGVHHDDTFDNECLMCAAGSVTSLAYATLGDSTPDHVGGSYQSSSLEAYFNGQLVASGSGTGVVLTDVPAGEATYRLVLTTDSEDPTSNSQSTHTVTDLTVKSHKTADPRSALPPLQTCEGKSADTPCQILPALNLTYNLASDLTNTSTSPVQAMTVTVGHISYDDKGSTAPITSLRVRVSFDGGTTWHSASVSGSNGQYAALWSNPASATGTSPMLQVTATDALGGSIQQTVTNAYTVAPASTS